ncbi:CPBP family intramembrane glutamic endopeptidase [Rhodobacter ferrooxidans]|uniref:Abortive infection protein n=1 Tax=Rhodobacter ferrooxidans TaxID=371731 RepID=C8S427_9RHOB|nr:CPBP family intramembrane glutamic endopeptidase [Rhodobacter sp. SW2]EEW24289.1 Abortive infection protein [Rhodobacter sp. SW2]
MNAQTSSVLSTIRAILNFPLIRIPLLGGILFLGMGISNGFMANNRDSIPTALVLVLLMVALALAIYWAFVRFVENRQVSELFLSGLGGEFGLGLLLGFGLYSACILILVLLGHYRIEGLNAWTLMLPMVPMAISSSFLEELIHRGVLFRVTEEYLGSWIALITTSAFFGARHLGNQDATVIGAVFIAIEAGVLLAAAYMVTRRLWLSIGFHMSWNFTQAAIFSGTVSGIEMPPGLVKAVIEGPELMTGGKFGVEASVVAFLLCTATGVALLWQAIRRSRILSPMWSIGR